jgi:hypothetical protein
LVIIVLLITAIAINQMRVFRKTGWLPHYLGWYILGGHVVLVLAKLPGLNLRIHHYILAMVLMPGTALPTRVSAICQGYLLGLFLNGAAAFGFDSILQTSADVRPEPPRLRASDWLIFFLFSFGSSNKTRRWAPTYPPSLPTPPTLSPRCPLRIRRYSGMLSRTAGTGSRSSWTTSSASSGMRSTSRWRPLSPPSRISSGLLYVFSLGTSRLALTRRPVHFGWEHGRFHQRCNTAF